MKPRIPRVVSLMVALATFSFASSSLAADRSLTIEDILRLHFGGISEEIIVSEVLVTESVFELSVDEILRLKDAGLSEELIQFLVETALDPADYGEYEAQPGESKTSESADSESYAEIWYNEIEEPDPTIVVSLNYNYPTWWYDFYWWDYWHYDHHYYPYNYSYIAACGTWYPAWYSYRHCYLPSNWGYRSNYYAGVGVDWGYSNCQTYYSHDAYYTPDARYDRSHPLSRVKYKSGGGTSGALIADVGLKVRDPLHVAKTKTRSLARGERTKVKHLVVADGRKLRTPGSDLRKPDRELRKPGGDRIRRPIKSNSLPTRGGGVRPTKPTRRLAGDEVRRDWRRPTRRPVVSKPPTRHVTPASKAGVEVRPTKPKPSRPGKPTVQGDPESRDRPSGPTPKPKPNSGSKPKPGDKKVQKKSAPKPTSEVKSRPAPRPKQMGPRQSGPRVSPSRPAPSPKAPPQRSAPAKPRPKRHR